MPPKLYNPDKFVKIPLPRFTSYCICTNWKVCIFSFKKTIIHLFGSPLYSLKFFLGSCEFRQSCRRTCLVHRNVRIRRRHFTFSRRLVHRQKDCLDRKSCCSFERNELSASDRTPPDPGSGLHPQLSRLNIYSGYRGTLNTQLFGVQYSNRC